MNFYSDFLVHSPYFNKTTRVAELDYLEPVTRAAVTSIMSDAETMGHKLLLFETYRSQARQEFLFKQGATQLQTVGCHNYGLAADFALDLYGQPSWQGDFDFIGGLAKKHGLLWGGTWAKFRDLGHVQRVALDDQPKLFNGTWWPAEAYSPTSAVTVAV
jgi:hypothetical protein